MKFAAATFFALVALAGAKKHSECGQGAAHHHKHHSASSAAHSATISISSVGEIHSSSVAASSSVSAVSSAASSSSSASAIASSASSTRSTVKVTSTVTASSTFASPTTNIAIATNISVNSPSHSSVSSTVTASSTSKATSTTPKATTTKVSSTSTPTATVIPVSSGSGSNKRGLGFNDISATLPFSGAVSWTYNWDSRHASSPSLASGTEFVPMLWGTGNDHTSQWTANAQAAINAGATHLLGFNEPDLGSQSNLSPQAAAGAWKKYMQPFAGKAKLVSPAVTNGGAPMGTAWLEDFFDECDGCTIDAVAIHIYDSASNVGYFKNYISDVGTKFGKPVWVTEFGASGSVDAQSAFLKEMVPFLNNLASVERFAYFGDFEGTFVQNGKLLPLGKAYASA